MSSRFEELASQWRELVTKSLGDLEKWGLTKVGLLEGKKIYQLTDKGRELLKKAVANHMERVSSVRSWFIRMLVDLRIIEETDLDKELSQALQPMREAMLMLLGEQPSDQARIETLTELKEAVEHLNDSLNRMADQIDRRIEKLRST